MVKNQGWKVLICDWITEQGVPTVLLVGILIGLWVGGPKLIASMNDSNEKQTTQIVKAFVDDQERDQEERKRDDEVNSDLIRELFNRTGVNITTGVDKEPEAVIYGEGNQ